MPDIQWISFLCGGAGVLVGLGLLHGIRAINTLYNERNLYRARSESLKEKLTAAEYDIKTYRDQIAGKKP
jgi:hypothetical protein